MPQQGTDHRVNATTPRREGAVGAQFQQGATIAAKLKI